MDGGDKKSSSSQSDNERKERIEGSDDIPKLSLEKLVEYTVSKFLDAAPVIGEGYAKLATMVKETYDKKVGQFVGEKKLPKKIVYTAAGGKKAVGGVVATALIGAAQYAKSAKDDQDRQKTKSKVSNLDTKVEYLTSDLEETRKIAKKLVEKTEALEEKTEKLAKEREKLAEEREKLEEEREKLAEERKRYANTLAEENRQLKMDLYTKMQQEEVAKQHSSKTGGSASLRNPVESLKSYMSSPRDVEESQDKTTKRQSGIEE